MSKRNITFTKPEEPNFLKRLKQQIGYKEGPTVDTKRENLGPAEDVSDTEEEQPTVVVLNEGDLSAEEARSEKTRLEKEAAEAPADLNTRILFKAPSKAKSSEDKPQKSTSSEESKSKGEKVKSKKGKSKALLSFALDEEENEDE